MQERLERLRALAAQDPANVLLACEVFDAELAVGDLVRAGETLARARGHDPDAAAVRFREASLGLAQGEFAAAEQRLSEVIAVVDVDPVALHNLALAQFCQGAIERALDTLARAAAHLAEHPPLARLQARVFHRLQRHDDALAVLQPRLAPEVEDAEARGLAAVLFHEAGDAASAQSAADAALGQDPAQYEALLVSATLALEAGRYEAARRLVAKLVENHGRSGYSWWVAAQLAIAHFEFELADEALGRAAHRMSRDPRVWVIAAWCALVRGDATAAEARIASGVEVGAEALDVAAVRALIAVERGVAPDPGALPSEHPVAVLISALNAQRSGVPDAVEAAVLDVLDRRVAPGGPTVRTMLQGMLAARAGVRPPE